MVKQGGRKQKNTPKIGKHQWIIGGAIIALSTLLLVFLSWFFYTGSTKEIVAVADQFKPDSSWELVSENIQPPATVCIDIECPSVHRSWNTHTLISKEKLVKQINLSGWSFHIDNDCILSPDIFGAGITVCSAKGVIGDYAVTVSINGSNSPGSAYISLSIERR